MKRHLRNLAFFLLGFFGVAVFMLARAETIAASVGTVTAQYKFRIASETYEQSYPSAAAACSQAKDLDLPCAPADQPFLPSPTTRCVSTHPLRAGAFCVYAQWRCPDNFQFDMAKGGCYRDNQPYCPSGGYTLSADGKTCTRPDCSSGQVRQADGSCLTPCPAKELGRYWYTYVPSSPPWGRFCRGGCEVNVVGPIVDSANPDGEYYLSGPFRIDRGVEQQSGGQCSGGNSPPTPNSTNPPTPRKNPPCAAGEGVLTSSSGKVACVPSGTPAAQAPKVGTKTSTTQNPDGTTVINNTTTTCTGEGACSSTTTTTVSSSSGSPQTTTKTTDSNSTNGGSNGVGATGGGGGGGDGGCDPTVQMCTSPETTGLYTKKEETFAGPLSRFTNGLKSSVLGQNATGFFTVSLPTGSCPNWSTSQSVMGRTFVVDLRPVFCSEAGDKAMQVIGTVLMVVAAFGAFRWAIL